MDNELQFLSVNGENYEISDKQAREDIATIKGKSYLTDAKLTSSYTTATKTLTLSVTVTK